MVRSKQVSNRRVGVCLSCRAWPCACRRHVVCKFQVLGSPVLHDTLSSRLAGPQPSMLWKNQTALCERSHHPRVTLRNGSGPNQRGAGRPVGEDSKTPRPARSGPPLEIPVHKAKDAPSSLITVIWIRRTRLSCVWRGLLFATPLEVVLDRRRSDAQSPCARVRPRRAVDITRSHAADACSRMPSACATRRMVSSRGCDDGCSAL